MTGALFRRTANGLSTASRRVSSNLIRGRRTIATDWDEGAETGASESLAETISDVLGVAEFSLAAYLAEVGNWRAGDLGPIGTVLAEHASRQQILSKRLFDQLAELRGRRSVTCFPSEFTQFNDLDLTVVRKRILAYVEQDIDRL
jgi:hypothetical protein